MITKGKSGTYHAHLDAAGCVRPPLDGYSCPTFSESHAERMAKLFPVTAPTAIPRCDGLFTITERGRTRNVDSVARVVTALGEVKGTIWREGRKWFHNGGGNGSYAYTSCTLGGHRNRTAATVHMLFGD